MIKRVIIMAGGTGGHVFPALAVAQALKKQGVEVSWMGTQRGLEADVVPKAGFDIDWITISGLRGNGLLGWLQAPFKLLVAALQARKIIKQRNPDLVLGMGGFVTGPGGVMAWISKKPLIIHEQNAIPGLTNKLLAKIARRVLQAFPNAFAANKHALAIGNPVREVFTCIAKPSERLAGRENNKFRLLVVGGSLGALALNKIVPEALKTLKNSDGFDVWHQTGKRHLDVTLKAYEQDELNARVVPFIDDMAKAYGWADLVLCRSGALTVSELAAVGVASILVPYPHAVDDHQTVNAQFLVDAGAAELIQQADLTVERLADLLERFSSDRQQVLKMAEAAYSRRQTDSVEKVIEQCYEVAHV